MYKLQKFALFVIVLCSMITSFSQSALGQFVNPAGGYNYYLALSFDGNAQDTDDVSAFPMALAMIAEAGEKDRLLFVDYSNHIWGNDVTISTGTTVCDDYSEDMHKLMQESSEAILRWGFDPTIFFEITDKSEGTGDRNSATISTYITQAERNATTTDTDANLDAAKDAFLKAARKAESESRPLFYLIGGPVEVPYRMLKHVKDQTDGATLLSNIILVTHSTCNDDYGCTGGCGSRILQSGDTPLTTNICLDASNANQDLEALITADKNASPQGKLAGLRVIEIGDQNGNGTNRLKITRSGGTNGFDWLNSSGNFLWLHDQRPSDYKDETPNSSPDCQRNVKFDFSDAGMTYWAIQGFKGNDNGSPSTDAVDFIAGTGATSLVRFRVTSGGDYASSSSVQTLFGTDGGLSCNLSDSDGWTEASNATSDHSTSQICHDAQSTGTSDDIFTLRAAGTVIGGTSDNFQFIHKGLSTSNSITAQVTNFEGRFTDAVGGVMMREDVGNANSGSVMAALVLEPTSTFDANGNRKYEVSLVSRTSTDGTASSVKLSAFSEVLPLSLRLEVQGSTVTGYVSTDGTTWQEVSDASITFTSAEVGVAATSGEGDQLAAVAFTNVEIATTATGTTCSLSTGWASADIGSVGAAGETCEDGATFTMQSTGDNIGKTDEGFHFAYQDFSGDIEINATLTSIVETGNLNAKVGVMIREGVTDAFAKSATLIYRVAAGSKATLFTRSSNAQVDATRVTSADAYSYNVQLKLRKIGDVFSAYVYDGTEWDLIGSETISMSSDLKVGLVAASLETTQTITAEFTNVTIGSPCALPTDWSNQDVGTLSPAGEACYDSVTEEFTLKAPDGNIGSTEDDFHFVYQDISGDQEIIALISSADVFNTTAKVGVMMRETLNDDSDMAAMLLRLNEKTFFFSRDGGVADAGPTTNQIGVPYWVRLTREGDTFKGYIKSTTASNWTQIESVTISGFANSYKIGLAYNSKETTLQSAVFENVSIAPYSSSAIQGVSGLQSQAVNVVAVYPNELVSNQVRTTLSKPVRGNVKVIVHNSMGELQGEGTLELPEARANLDIDFEQLEVNLPKGVYIITLQGNEFATKFRLVK